jgi:hypothetical protein
MRFRPLKTLKYTTKVTKEGKEKKRKKVKRSRGKNEIGKYRDDGSKGRRSTERRDRMTEE